MRVYYLIMRCVQFGINKARDVWQNWENFQISRVLIILIKLYQHLNSTTFENLSERFIEDLYQNLEHFSYLVLYRVKYLPAISFALEK